MVYRRSSGSNADTGPTAPRGSLRVIHAARGAVTLDVLVDGGVVIDGPAAGTVSSAVLNPIVVTDTGRAPAPGRTKLQVANFASAAGPIDVYRRQPDFDGLLDLVFPFAYRTPSGSVQSDPGTGRCSSRRRRASMACRPMSPGTRS